MSTGLGKPRKKRKGKPKTTAEIIEKDFSDSEEDSRANFNNNSAREETSRDSFFDQHKKKKKTLKPDKIPEEEDTLTRDSVDIKKKKKKVRENSNYFSSVADSSVKKLFLHVCDAITCILGD